VSGGMTRNFLRDSMFCALRVRRILGQR
jgi:hypothetical protein